MEGVINYSNILTNSWTQKQNQEKFLEKKADLGKKDNERTERKEKKLIYNEHYLNFCIILFSLLM